MNVLSPAITHLVHDARAHGSRTVQTVVLLVTVACVLLAASMQDALSEHLLAELLLLLPIAGVLTYALGVCQRIDMRLNAPLRELAESPAFQQALLQADTRLQRVRGDVRALLLQGCILLDSFVWSRIALPTPLSLRIEHLHALLALIEGWRRSCSLSGVVDALAAQLLSGIDAKPLRRLLEQLAAAITPRRARTSSGVLLSLPALPAPGCLAQAVLPALNRLC